MFDSMTQVFFVRNIENLPGQSVGKLNKHIYISPLGLVRALTYISKNDNEDMLRKKETTKEMISIYPLWNFHLYNKIPGPHGFLMVPLKSSLRKFYDRLHDLVNGYGVSMSQKTTDSSFNTATCTTSGAGIAYQF